MDRFGVASRIGLRPLDGTSWSIVVGTDDFLGWMDLVFKVEDVGLS